VKLAKVPSPWIWGESERIPDIRTFMRRLDESAKNWPMTMGWVDCLCRGNKMGRGTLFAGRWATPDEAPARFPQPKPRVSVPFVLPGFLMNNFTMKVFNAAIYWKHWRRKQVGIVHPETFFWPLDAIHHWNRGYGPRGFTQHQCVLPKSGGPDVAVRFLDLLTQKGGASFLCVIKDCGDQGKGVLSFPRPGISIALDIPVRDDTQALIDTLNEFVIAEGGRIYLTKDAFTRADHFAAMEPRLERFNQIRRKWDPDRKLRSAQSVRMLGDGA
jgi:FAD/FMN-containing dehydrogenase